MTCIDRRQMLVLGLGVAAASTTLSRSFVHEVQAAPLAPRADILQEPTQGVEKAQVVVVDPRRRRRRHRRWVCWWHRRRRVCGWRWR
jgi:predicted protein tyrosine phosphatase